jgi:glycogen debranching enzyme
MQRPELELAAQDILLGNLRRGTAEWNGQEYSFVVPSLTGYPFQWFWDSCFHAIALIHIDLNQAKAELDTLMSAALTNGFIPHIIFWESEKRDYFLSRNLVATINPNFSSTIQPPILAYAVERVYHATGDEAFLQRSLPVLVKYYRWLKENRDPDGDGLLAIIQPEEAGTDCSPKYDEILGLTDLSNKGFIEALNKIYSSYELIRSDETGMLNADVFHVEDVLVNSIYALGLQSLARLLGNSIESLEFRDDASKTMESLVNKCWDVDTEAFLDLNGLQEIPNRTVTISSLMPIILPDLSPDIVKRLVEKWIISEDHFWLPYPLPSVPASNSKFIPGDPHGFIWRGPSWINTNWFITKGLKLHGYQELADDISAKSLACIQKSGFREYYNPYTGEGLGAKNFGWSTLILDM